MEWDNPEDNHLHIQNSRYGNHDSRQHASHYNHLRESNDYYENPNSRRHLEIYYERPTKWENPARSRNSSYFNDSIRRQSYNVPQHSTREQELPKPMQQQQWKKNHKIRSRRGQQRPKATKPFCPLNNIGRTQKQWRNKVRRLKKKVNKLKFQLQRQVAPDNDNDNTFAVVDATDSDLETDFEAADNHNFSIELDVSDDDVNSGKVNCK